LIFKHNERVNRKSNQKNKLKQRIKAEGSEVVTICHGLKLEAPEEVLLRILKSFAIAARVHDPHGVAVGYVEYPFQG